MSNLTFMDGDPFSEFDIKNGTFEEDYDIERNILFQVIYVIMEITKLVVCLGSTGASVFLIYVISKFERLKTKTNIFLLHYGIACSVDMIMIPFFMIIHEFLFHHWIWMCFAYHGCIATTIMIFIFATAVTVYWFLQTFRTKWLQNRHRFQLIFTIVLYIICFIKFIICFSECFLANYMFTSHLLVVVYVTMLATIIGINGYTFKNGLNDVQRKTQYQLCISTYIIFSYFPFLLMSQILYATEYIIDTRVEYFCMFLYCMSEIFAYSGPIVVVYLLGQKNKYFKAAYNKVFKRSIRNYEDELEDDSEHEQVEPVQDSTQTNGLINSSIYPVVV